MGIVKNSAVLSSSGSQPKWFGDASGVFCSIAQPSANIAQKLCTLLSVKILIIHSQRYLFRDRCLKGLAEILSSLFLECILKLIFLHTTKIDLALVIQKIPHLQMIAKPNDYYLPVN